MIMGTNMGANTNILCMWVQMPLDNLDPMLSCWGRPIEDAKAVGFVFLEVTTTTLQGKSVGYDDWGQGRGNSFARERAS